MRILLNTLTDLFLAVILACVLIKLVHVLLPTLDRLSVQPFYRQLQQNLNRNILLLSHHPFRPVSSTQSPSRPVALPRPQPPESVSPLSGHNPALKPLEFTPKEIQYFLEVALGSEFGNSEPKIKKWVGPIRIRVHGTPTPADQATLNQVITEINHLVPSLNLTRDAIVANLEIYFVPESQFIRYEPNYRPINYGFFWLRSQQYILTQGKILISSEGMTQQERSHLIREELTQALGLMRDSYRYPKSIFYQPWTHTTRYTQLDEALIRLLYRPEIQPGMNRSDILRVLQTARPGTNID
ncbi:hypothetical protein BST81_23080 [Leptolyngbya sp. 'hensonii']|uniref:DUF2927 domain-containing protein n=1 Tax=Leptolyngbya sp. 'hensonii' TaxID=1922337 RepID=UPI00094FA84B|nr:DUF2927 domain-containing protein [Leptolyngbya sp. 'hensonii']OLP16110.1 hypothetical protein BST81_23080 [Leptolyngbya sp. 'hensonii']